MSDPFHSYHDYLDSRVRLFVGDLTEHAVDAIVNAANSTLLGGGGVDGAIHRCGGPAILEACRHLRHTRWPDGLPTGQVAVTTGGRLAAPLVIHTVGPIWGQHHGSEASLLADCYRNAIALAADRCLSRIAFPAISTGVYGYPAPEAAAVASKAIADALARHAVIKEVRLVFHTPEQMAIFAAHQQFGC